MSGKAERLFGAILGIAIFATANTAAAQTSQTQACATALFDLEETRDTLDELRVVVDTARANRATLRNGADELTTLIDQAPTLGEAAKLFADREAVLDEIAIIDQLLPPIEAQTKALASEVATTEQTHLTCEID